MANLVVSNVCNLHCDYCFARDYLSEAGEGDYISEQAFEERLDFLKRSDIEDVRLIGGEPGLHPHFGDLLEMAAKRFEKMVVFSNGTFNEAALEALERLPAERITVMVNLSAGRTSEGLSKTEQNRRSQALQRLGRRVIAAYTIQRADFDGEALLPLILENGCWKSIRLGLAQPSLAGKNRFLHPKQYPAVGRRIVSFAQTAAQSGIRVELDCGFVRCMFGEDDLKKLAEVNAHAEWRCNAVLDIGLQGSVSHCFPLAGRIESMLEPGICAADLRETLAAQTKPYRSAGIYRECSTCGYKARQECTGGCLAATMLRFRKAEFQFKLENSI